MERAGSPSSAVFDQAAAGYDALRRRLIPCFDPFYRATLDLIEEHWPPGRSRARVLDLGAGTGLLSAFVFARRPEARIRLIDASEAMLEQARRRFGGRHDAEFRRADLSSSALDGPWDLVISALAIHHLEDAAKRDLFKRIHAALTPGGLFVNAEQVLGPTLAIEARYHRIWLEAVRSAGAPEIEVERTLERMSFDRCATVENQMLWMRDAGLKDVDCSFKEWRFAVMSGRAEGASGA
jgi:tRNA (cmo5U34)-methyltransferase